ncbi:MAG: hypothetical protein FJ278_16005, partial [Planctomycetes bacterium]|nr:hypothetical protein [Planctomycetota bacterium]
IADGKWHYVAMIMEETRVRLYVDGQEKANEGVTATPAQGAPGPLAMGALVEGNLVCDGAIDEVRLSKCVRQIGEPPSAEFVADEHTVGLWHFSKAAPGQDSSRLANHGQLRRKMAWVAPSGREIPGGMSTAYQPLPPAEDAAPMREALRQVARDVGLRTVDADQIRDGVLQEWSYDFKWHGKKEYPQHRVGEVDKEKLKREAFDEHALIWESDGGPVGTVLRRTAALLQNLADSAKLASLVSDCRALRAAYETAKPASDSDLYRAFYLAACALRRQVALSNPLLDFDTILFVARGTFEGSVRSNPATADVQGGHFVTQYFGFNALPGGGLFMVRNFKTKPEIVNVLANSVAQNGRLKGKKLDYGAFATPDLSYDGKTIVFAWTENKEHKWVYSQKTCFHLFKVNVDGSNLVQLSDGAFNDFDPCWLPNGRIAFISERRGGYIRCFAACTSRCATTRSSP